MAIAIMPNAQARSVMSSVIKESTGHRDWGLGIGDWGLGIGDWGLGIGFRKKSYLVPSPQFIVPSA